MQQRQRIRKEVLKILKNHGHRSFRPKELAKKLNLEDNKEYRLFREILEELRETGAVVSAKGGRVSYRSQAAELKGVLHVHPDGYGFVNVEDEDLDYFVRARRMNTAIDGDLVLIGKSAPAKGDRRRSAEVLRVLERSRTTAVGSLHHAGSYAVVIPDDLRLTHDVYVSIDELLGANEGDKVVVSIDAFEDRRGALHGRIIEVLGPSSDPEVQTLALAMSQGVHVSFPEAALQEASNLQVSIPESEISRRLDLREKMVFTIDPADARDFDDALHIEVNDGGGYELGVHIADVSFFVSEDSAIDKEAFRRGTSVYLVDRAIPMLPERLSSDACSLRPMHDRLAFSCIMQVSAEGDVLSHSLVETVIHSRHRLTYEEAQSMLSSSKPEYALAEALAAVNGLAQTLARRRRKEGSIDFGMREVKIDLDETGHPVAIRRRERLESHRLIEECMLLANRVVAEALIAAESRAAVSRIHEHPDREKIKQLARYVGALAYELPHTEGLVRSKDLNILLESVRDKPEAPVIEQAALRAMAKARYGIERTGHYGLSFRHYTHFTSPIRRYPDLVVHRLVKRMNAGRPGIDAAALKRMCEYTSERERIAVEAERASLALKKVMYAADHVGDEFEGVVSSVSRFGVYIELTDLLVEGMVHVRDMTDDYYEYDERKFSLIGYQNGRKYRPGDSVRITLVAARLESREIDLQFTDQRDMPRKRKKRRER